MYPLATSSASTARAGFQPNARSMFVAPALPLPSLRMSRPYSPRLIGTELGQDPSR